MTTPALTRSIGAAERALRALLERELVNEQLTFAQWTALVFTRSAPLSKQQVVYQQFAGRIVASEPEAGETIADLVAIGALTDTDAGLLQHSAEGRDLFTRVGGAVERITGNLYGDLPPADLEATHRTLLEIVARAEKLLAAT